MELIESAKSEDASVSMGMEDPLLVLLKLVFSNISIIGIHLCQNIHSIFQNGPKHTSHQECRIGSGYAPLSCFELTHSVNIMRLSEVLY